MNPLETYQSDAVERPLIRRRLIVALIASLALHAGLVWWFRQTRLEQFTPPTARLVPRIFSVKSITINEAALEADDNKTEQKKPDVKPAVQALQVPDEKPVADIQEGKMVPAVPQTADVVKPIASERVTDAGSEVKAIARLQENTSRIMDQELSSIRDSLLKDQPANVAHAQIKLPASGNVARDDAAGMAAASGRLDTLLGHGLRAGTAPVTLPGGAVFEFGSAELLPAAIDQLRKLGMLIKKNPDVTFSIEGYTDSIGDASYNQQLSQARADSVRQWLIQNMDIDPTHIQSTGFGANNFIVQPRPVDLHSAGSIEQAKALEQPNRRVEIRFKFPKGQ